MARAKYHKNPHRRGSASGTTWGVDLGMDIPTEREPLRKFFQENLQSAQITQKHPQIHMQKHACKGNKTFQDRPRKIAIENPWWRC